MNRFRIAVSQYSVLLCAAAVACILLPGVQAQAPPARVIGTVKSVSGNTVVITLDNGSENTISFTDSARIVRAAPGQTDLKSAPPIQISDIQVGDRISARGQAGENSILVAYFALVMSKSDIAQKQERERDEWRKGVGGLVKE